MRIAIIGSGISGLTAAYVLNRKHDICVFEAGDYIGGHTATKQIVFDGESHSIDTGFIVFNDRTYPNFEKLLAQLGIQGQESEMSFSVTSKSLEYAGSNFKTLFAQRRNFFNIPYLRMLIDIVRFNKKAIADLHDNKLDTTSTLGEYIAQHGYSDMFRDYYLVPMAAAIWSNGNKEILAFPAQFFIRFFFNHGLLALKNRPQWYVVPGGSNQYIEPLTADFREKIYLKTPVLAVNRNDSGVVLRTEQGSQVFDHVVFACHSDQALQILLDPSEAERDVLSAIPYQANDVVLHTDESLLPESRLAWSSWNYNLHALEYERATLTYNMNILQGIQSRNTFCVTLNNVDQIQSDKILGQYQYAHPVFSLNGEKAKKRWSDVNGLNRTWFCGAWWHNGFHEDGVKSALRVVEKFGMEL